jgi:hypothetical protein
MSEKAPTGMAMGETVVSCGMGFSSVTALEAVLSEWLVSVAVTVMLLGVGGNSGAVNKPAEEIVPVVALPPATPFTDQIRDGCEWSLVSAVNCRVLVPWTEIVAGLRVIEKTNGPSVPLFGTEAHPANASAAHDTKRIFNRFTALSPLHSDSKTNGTKWPDGGAFSHLLRTAGRAVKE